jgi:DNA-binding IclR family transcriptional regulator
MPLRPSPLQPPDKDGTQSLRRGLAALRLLASGPRDGMRMTDIVARMGLNKTTVVRITKALCDEQFLDFDAQHKLYRLGPESFAIGLAAEPNYVLQRLANPLLDALAKASGDTVFFSIRAGFEAICLSRHEGNFPIRTQVLKPGDRFPLGVGAGSVAMLAALHDMEVQTILQTNAPWITAQYARCTLSAIKTQVRTAREKGYSVNPGLVVEGSWGIGVAVMNATGEVVAAISLAAIEKRLSLSRRTLLANQLMLASQEITELLTMAQ